MAYQGSNYFPRQDIPESEKTDAWKSLHLDYSEFLLKNSNSTRQRFTRLMDGYNGVVDPEALAWITQRYGKVDKAPFITYKLGRVKIDLLNGEWLKRPLVSTVTTIDSNAVSNKMEQLDFLKGAMVAKDAIVAIKEKAGVDLMEGMDIPEDESVFETMNFKEKNEEVMQVITNQQIKKLDVKKRLSECFLNLEITNYCGALVEMDEQGKISMSDIDPRDCIFEAIKGDDYAEKSPIKGCRRTLPVHQILMRYNFTKEQRDILEAARNNQIDYAGSSGRSRGFMSLVNGELNCDVIHIEWDSVTPLYYKIVSTTHPQAADYTDDDGTILPIEIDAADYEKNIKYHEKNVSKGYYKIVTKYKSERYEATRIGGLIDINMRKVQGKKRSIDNLSDILSSTYIFYVHGRVNGVTVSLQQLMENYDNLYNVTQFMINRELAKAKGKILTIDRSAIGTKDKIIDQLYRMVNDQVLEYDSSASGNVGGRQLDPAMMFKTLDLGLSDSFGELINFKRDLVNDINQITGINENRQGVTAASSTATAQQSDIYNSRTITEALFYGFSGFTKRVLKAIVDKSAISYAFYRTEEAEQVLGSERFSFLQATVDLAYHDYALEIEDGSLYAELSSKIEQLMQVSLNAKELRMMDAMNVMLSQTLAEKKAFLEKGWADVERIRQEMSAQEQQMAAQMNQQNLQTQLQIAQENREDLQAGKLDEINTKTEGQIAIDNNRAANDSELLRQKTMGDIITKTEPPI